MSPDTLRQETTEGASLSIEPLYRMRISVLKDEEGAKDCPIRMFVRNPSFYSLLYFILSQSQSQSHFCQKSAYTILLSIDIQQLSRLAKRCRQLHGYIRRGLLGVHNRQGRCPRR
jgi:hypothetical protein